MTKKLLSLFIVLLGMLGWNVTYAHPWTGSAPEAGKNYYLYSKIQDKFLNDANGLSSVEEVTTTWRLENHTSGDAGVGRFIFNSNNGNRLAMYRDRANILQPYTYHITTNENFHGNSSNVYMTLGKEGDYYSIYRSNKRDNWEEDRNIATTSTFIKIQADASYEWMFISEEEFDEKTSTYYYDVKAYCNYYNAGTASINFQNNFSSNEQTITASVTDNDAENYEFKGWSTTINGEVFSTDHNVNYNITSSSNDENSPTITYLYAQYEKKNTGNSLRFVSYNVDGLPGSTEVLGINVNNNCPGTIGTRLMGEKLADLGVDFVGVQEDFNFNSSLYDGLKSKGQSYDSGHEPGVFGWATVEGLRKIKSDGLNAFWKTGIKVDNESTVEWEDKDGNLDLSGGDFDENLEKGYRSYRMTVKDEDGTETFIDIYNLHADAESDAEDIAARNSELSQLANAINAGNDTRPKIVMGDFNSRYTREQIKTLFLDAIENEGLFTAKDAWIEIFRKDEGYPAHNASWSDNNNATDLTGSNRNSGDCEVVDKIFYINPTKEGCIQLKLENCRFATEFTYDNACNERFGNRTISHNAGEILGDHYPIIADFTIVGKAEHIDVTTANWIWKGETGGDGTDVTNEGTSTGGNVCYNNKTLTTESYYMHNVGTNTFVRTRGKAMTLDVEKADKITLDGNSESHIKHSSDAGYIFFAGTRNLDTNYPTTTADLLERVPGNLRWNIDIKYNFTPNVFSNDYPNCYLISYNSMVPNWVSNLLGGDPDAYLMMTGTSEGSSMTKSSQHDLESNKKAASANWQFISETQKSVYLKYVEALQQAYTYVKEIDASNGSKKFATQEIEKYLRDELKGTEKRWWYQDAVRIFIENVGKLQTSNFAINSSAEYGTFVAPYDVEIPEGVTAYTVKTQSGTNILALTECNEEGKIPACTPVLTYKGNGQPAIEYYGFVNDNDVKTYKYTWDNAASTVVDNTNTVRPEVDNLRGTLVARTKQKFDNEKAYMLQKQGDKVAFFRCNPDWEYNLSKNRCLLINYGEDFSSPQTASVKVFYLHAWDDPDGIEDNVIESKSSDVYDLSGRRVSNPHQGIYIKNGKKVYVKE